MMPPRDQLTPKEIRVATLVWEGLTNREIAKIIGTTEQVVKNYLRTAFDKLGVWSRLELALYVANHGGASWASTPADVETHAGAEAQVARLAYAGR
jgi:DNA-binding NarL/FixJ family response regulator